MILEGFGSSSLAVIPILLVKISHAFVAANLSAATSPSQGKYGVTEKIGQGITTAATKTVEFERDHQVTSRAMQAAKSSVDAARDMNQKYGITEKMGQGAAAAYSKA